MTESGPDPIGKKIPSLPAAKFMIGIPVTKLRGEHNKFTKPFCGLGTHTDDPQIQRKLGFYAYIQSTDSCIEGRLNTKSVIPDSNEPENLARSNSHSSWPPPVGQDPSGMVVFCDHASGEKGRGEVRDSLPLLFSIPGTTGSYLQVRGSDPSCHPYSNLKCLPRSKGALGSKV